ncbi:mechanosensitive ion channel domain-containing protein [Sorangium sp. So ce321]|uniref:mechanosensitive ion channel family protein n=1 Tax=Sorangium sp. So ce321 TaxID=3133300 RepID=UPI003F61F3CB
MEPDTDIADSAKLIETLQTGGVLTGIAILIIAWLAVRLLTAAIERSGIRHVHRRLLLNQVATLLRFGIYIGGIAAAVAASINLSREVVLALTGTVAVTVGFALKDLASSILAGLTLIVDRPFQVGDRVKFGDLYGEITTIGLRSVRLISEDNLLVTIPNNKFLTEAVASANHGRLDMMVAVQLFIAIDQDVGLAKRIVEECITSSRYVYLGQPPCVRVSQCVLGSFTAVRLDAEAHVLDMKYKQDYQSTLTERALKALREKRVLLHGEAPGPAPAADGKRAAA